MSQSSVVKTAKSSDSPLPSALKDVLGSLDVQLEDELTRYRRYRRQTTPASTSEQPSRSYTQKPSEVLSVSKQESKIEPGAASSDQSKSSAPKTPSGWESVVMSESAPLVPHSTQTESQFSPPDSNVQNSAFTSPSPETNEPEGYLESSQQLVKSLEERRARRRQRNWATTPVGIISLLLFFVSCMGLGYVVMSPSGMATLGLNRWFKSNDTQTAEETAEAERLAGSAEPQPNLAAREFVDLDLDTLSNINPNPKPIPTAPQTPTANPQNLTPPSPLPSGPGMNNLTNELLPEPVLPTPKPAQPQTVTPKPAAGAATKPKTNPIKANDGLYYVVTSYSNQQSLEKARTVVADAYVREFKTGRKVQLGALDNPEGAKRLAEQLRVQGIAVQFDTPKAGE